MGGRGMEERGMGERRMGKRGMGERGNGEWGDGERGNGEGGGRKWETGGGRGRSARFYKPQLCSLYNIYL
jgi:transcription termination factor Rho